MIYSEEVIGYPRYQYPLPLPIKAIFAEKSGTCEEIIIMITTTNKNKESKRNTREMFCSLTKPKPFPVDNKDVFMKYTIDMMRYKFKYRHRP